ncbi:MAG: zinc ABC transporter substrate-binding protein [Niameybacter sp.]|uniref:metal ABC transporter solute-binding protein, Zn/Mn family n=1 Tax=Niameybacter sp. TaxID=2033640 RepID=UPI002FC9DA45
MKKKTAILILLVIAYTGFILYKYNERTKLQQEIAHKPFTVVTSFYPMYIHTSALMKETPHQLLNMADQTVGCLHDYQLTVQDTKKLYEADVLVINGLGSETFIEKAYMQNPTLQVIDASQQLEPLLHGEEEAEGLHNHEQAHLEETHDGDEDPIHGEDGHHHENDHIWLSIEGTIAQVQEIAMQLSAIDPAYQSVYEANARAYIEALEALDEEAHQALEVIDTKKAMTVHDAFYYLAQEFGIEIVENIPEGSYENASAKQIQTLIHQMEEEDVKVIFTEEKNQDLAILKTIQREVPCSIYVLDALVTGTDQTFAPDEFPYVVRMRKNIETVREAFEHE